MAIICYTQFGLGGLGDTLRSMYSYFVFCRINKIDYYIYIPDDNPLKLCFNLKPIKSEHTKDITDFTDISGWNSELTDNFIKNININRNYSVNSNVFGFVAWSDLFLYKKEFLEFLDISDILKNRMGELISSKPDTSLHIRCGDSYMPTVNIGSDHRLDVDKIETYIEDILLYESDILLFTDNAKLKNSGKCKTLNSTIHHTSLRQNNNINSIDSVAEFFILGQSNKIIIISHSGFSFWAAFFNNIPLFKYNTSKQIVESYDYNDVRWT